MNEVSERKYWEEVDYKGANLFVKSNLMTGQRAAIAIGYYLKRIRDERLYLDGGYASFAEYVRAECGLSESTASRHISRMEQFSEGGNSPKLADQYADYSASQLQEMLYLTDEQRTQVTPEMTVKEIREVKKPEPTDSDIRALCEWFDIVATDNISPELLKRRFMHCGGGGGDKLKYFKGSRRGMSINYKQEITYTQLSKRINALLEADKERDASPEICVVLSDAETEQPCEGPCPYEETCDAASEDAVAEVTVELPDLEDAPGPAQCITGQSGSGICGAAAYCDQPYDCCAQCDEDCNGRCGWIPRRGADQGPEEPLGHKTESKRNPAMEGQARMCLSNLQVEIGAKAWPAALASARHLVHYLSLVVGEAAERGSD